MKRSYLYQLYQYSKPAFGVVLVFIVCYAVLLYKNMDMVLFPHNSMFSNQASNKTDTASTYAVKINGSLINISTFPYWKKDFIESSTGTFAQYIQQDKKVFLQQYLASKNNVPDYLLKTLVPPEKASSQWPLWLAEFAGHEAGKSIKVELYQYNFVFSNGNAVLKDSTLLFSQQTLRL